MVRSRRLCWRAPREGRCPERPRTVPPDAAVQATTRTAAAIARAAAGAPKARRRGAARVATRTDASAHVPRGLVYVSDEQPGIRRIRKGDGFVYRKPDGRPLRSQAELARIRKLAIPPAYEDVWICTDPR